MNKSMRKSDITTKVLFRLLPFQILLAAVGAVNGIVSSYFASNFVGMHAMSAVGLYAPLNMLLGSLSTLLVGGASILCGKYMGQNQQEKLQNVFSLDLLFSALIAVAFTVLFVIMGTLDLTGFLTKDAAVRPLLNRYLIGQAIGVMPFVISNQLTAFLSLENRGKRTTIASVVYIVVNLVLNFLFVQVLHLEAFGLALASSIGMWIFLGVQAQYFLEGKSHLYFSTRNLDWTEGLGIIRIGFPGAATNIYQTFRGLAVNHLLGVFVGSVGISAFATANNLLGIFWAVPAGMLAVSRIMISISVGEEDRKTLTDIMRNMFYRFLPLQCCISAILIALAVPLTRLFYQDPAEPVFMMTVWGLRILPLCMPLSVICMHFVCYGQTSKKDGLVNLLSLLDGVVSVVFFTWILIRFIGQNSIYIANVLNGVVTTMVIVGYAWLHGKRFPKTMEELMVIPEDFGVPEEERLDITVRSMEDVVSVAENVQTFCRARGIDERRSYFAGLCLEEMAGNVVDHGFKKDKKQNHSVDVRVVHKKDDTILLRIKDDCVPFDPGERQKLVEGDDPVKNIGIRMVFKSVHEIQYQNILGLNVTTITI